LKDVSTNFIKKIVIMIASIITSIVIARVLGPEGKGIYAMVMLVPSMLLLFGEFGITMSNIYFIGKKKIEKSVLASNSLFFGLINGVILVLIFLIIYPFIADSVFQGVDSSYIYAILLMIPFSLTTSYLGGILVGLLKIKEACIISIIQTVINTAMILLILLVFSGYIFELLILSIVMSISFFLFYTWYIGKLTGFVKYFSWKSFKKCFNYGSKGYVANTFTFFNYRLDMFLVNFFIGVTAVGYYSLSVGLVEMIWIVPQTISFVLFPFVASSNKKDAAELTASSCRHSFFLSSIMCLGALIFGQFLIGIVYGDVFLPSYLPLVGLLPGILFGSTGTLTSSYLNGIGKPIYSPIIASIALITNIVLNLILIPTYGIMGAAVASSITYSFAAFLGVYFFLKNSDVSFRNIYLIQKNDLLVYINKIRDILRI